MSRLCASVLGVAALSFAMSGCASEGSMSDPTATMSDGPRPTATATATSSSSTTTTTTATPTAPATPTPAPDARPAVDVVIVSWGAGDQGVYASGIVPGVLEDGATCTLTATSGSDVQSASRDAQRATDSTDCGVITINVPAGEWSLVLAYDSAGSRGVSAAQDVTAS